MSESSEKTILVDLFEHDIGKNPCVCCTSGYPKKCKCGGLIHGEIVGFKRGIAIREKCDKCGEMNDRAIY